MNLPKKIPTLTEKSKVRHFLQNKCNLSFRQANEILYEHICSIENKNIEEAKNSNKILPKTWYSILDDVVGLEFLQKTGFEVHFNY